MEVSSKQITYNNPFSITQNRVAVFDKNSEYDAFSSNTINQYDYLIRQTDGKTKDLIILDTPDDIEALKNIYPKLAEYIDSDGKDAYGINCNKENAICIIKSNHERKDEKYEGTIDQQGADTITHEFGHYIDNGFSESDNFRAAYQKDLENFAKNIENNPNETIANSDMTYLEAKEYFKHYIEGSDFSDGVDKNDVTKRGARENFAESYSIIFDSMPSLVNEIYTELFPNSIQEVQKTFVA